MVVTVEIITNPILPIVTLLVLLTCLTALTFIAMLLLCGIRPEDLEEANAL